MSAPTLREIWHSAAERVLQLSPSTPLTERIRIVSIERELHRALTESQTQKSQPTTEAESNGTR